MATVVLDNTSVSPWKPPADCPPGVTIEIEDWGAGSGGSGRVSTSVGGGGGGGGSYSRNFYTITAADVTNGIAFSIPAGGAGATGANAAAASSTSFGTAPTNLIPNNSNYGASTSPSTIPLGWTVTPSNLTATVIGLGVDATTKLNYIDFQFNGTTNNAFFVLNMGQGAMGVPGLPNQIYRVSGYIALLSANWTGVTGMDFHIYQNTTGVGTFVSPDLVYTPSLASLPATGTALTRFQSGNLTTAATTGSIGITVVFDCTNPTTFSNLQIRFAGFQLEKTNVTAVQVTPTSYCVASGGLAELTNAGALGDWSAGGGNASGNCHGMVSFHGGAGATRALGGGGAGAAGPDGVGAASSTATGATGDNTHGGAANTSNVLGGGGGSGTAVAGATGSAAGAPGGGGGGSTASTGTNTGGAGGRGQVRLTYTPTSYGPMTKPWRQRHMLMR